MKRFSILFSTMALLISLLGACSESTVQEDVPVTPPEEVKDFTLEVVEVTKNAIDFKVTPGDKQMTYIVLISERSYFEEFESDEAVMDDDLAWFQGQADNQAMNLDVFLRGLLKRGDLTDRQEGLQPESEYYLYAYGLNEQGELLTEMEKVLFKTKSLDMTDTTFEVTLSDIDFNSVKVKVTPSNSSALYFVNVFSEERYQYFGGSEEAFVNQLLYVRDYYLGKGATIEQMIANLALAGERELVFEDLLPNTKYYAYAIGIDRDFFANSATSIEEFSTLSAEASTLSFEIDLSEVTYEGVVGTVTPSNDTETYICSVQVAQVLEWYEKEEDLMNMVLEDLDYWYGGVEGALRTGASEVRYTGLFPETDYVVICFGWDQAPTTGISTFAFTTEPANGDPANFTATFDVSDITHNSASATIRPSNGCYYFLDWCDVESFEMMVQELGSNDAAAAYFIEEEIAYGTDWFGGSRIEYLTEMGAILGTTVYPIQGLNPDTEYLLMVMPVDLTTGEIASEKATLSEPFRTENKIWSDATVTFEFGNIYDGSALAELDPANFLQCMGYAVMPYKVEVNATAVNWYTQFYPYDMSEWITGDDSIYEELITYGYEWDPESVSLNREEGVAVMEWETVFTFLGMAEDAEGNFGHGTLETLSAQKDQVAPAEEFLEQLATPACLARPAHKSPLQAQQRKPHGLKR